MADEMAGYLEQKQLSEQFQGLVEAAIRRLAEGDAVGFKELMSSNMIAHAGDEMVEQVVTQQFMPFFSGAVGFGSETTVTNTTDNWGNQGLAFYKTVLSNDGVERPFVIYVVVEDGRAVVANLGPGKTYEDMHGGMSPGEQA